MGSGGCGGGGDGDGVFGAGGGADGSVGDMGDGGGDLGHGGGTSGVGGGDEGGGAGGGGGMEHAELHVTGHELWTSVPTVASVQNDASSEQVAGVPRKFSPVRAASLHGGCGVGGGGDGSGGGGARTAWHMPHVTGHAVRTEWPLSRCPQKSNSSVHVAFTPHKVNPVIVSSASTHAGRGGGNGACRGFEGDGGAAVTT